MKITTAIILTFLASSWLHMANAEEAASSMAPTPQSPATKPPAEALSGKPIEGSNNNCPVLNTDDAWVYRQTQDIPNNPPHVSYTQFQVVFRNRNNSAAMEYVDAEHGHVKKDFGENFLHHVHFTVPDRTCLLDVMNGKSISTKQPFSFPPAAGSEWAEDEVLQGTQLIDSYKVIGTEKIKVDAGTFEAIRIEVASRPKPSEAPEKSGGLQWNERLCTYWYADEIKSMAKSACEFSDKSRHRLFSLMNELDAYELHAMPGKTP